MHVHVHVYMFSWEGVRYTWLVVREMLLADMVSGWCYIWKIFMF